MAVSTEIFSRPIDSVKAFADAFRLREEKFRCLNAELEQRIAERTRDLEKSNRSLEAEIEVRSNASRRVIPGVHLGSDELTLKRIIARGEEEFRTYAGYSGWGPGQLDNEIARGDWHVVPAERRFIFDPLPAEVWDELIQRVDTQVAKLQQ